MSVFSIIEVDTIKQCEKPMGIVSSICEKLGKANEPVYTVAAVALFKGIFRPTFTMMDKKQDPETKKYAAIKEGTTELIAIPTYIGLSYAVQKLAPAFATDKTIAKTLESSKRTLGFLGVCFAALYAIPKLCNMAMPHVMKILKMDKKDAKPKILPNETLVKADPISQNFNNTQITKIQPNYAKTPISMNGGMRV